MSVLFLAVVTGLRLFNPGDAAAPARVTCDGNTVAYQLAPKGVQDVDGSHCAAASAAPLLVLETGADDGVEWQRAIAANDAECPAALPLMAPLSGCRFGSAVAAVTPVSGASYTWSIDGGELLSGAGSDRVTIALGGGDAVKLSVAVATARCTSTATGIVALHDAFSIASFSPGAGRRGEPRTIAWTYANGAPAEQILSGTDFAPVVLPNDARSFSYTPTTDGDKKVILQAHSGASPPVGRAHAAGRGTAAASDCSTARATASYHIDCLPPDATITVPPSVNADTPFTARVHLDAGATAKWTIANGTPSTATGESVTIKATSNAGVGIGVTVTAGACAASGSARVAVVASPCDNPAVEVVVLPRANCSTVVEARFTGKPPFRGTWNDGVSFVSDAYTFDRPVIAAGTFFIATMQDATCAGAGSNHVAAVPNNGVSAVLSAPAGLCTTGAQAVATFTGTPPFSGTWSDGVPFTTASYQTSRPVTHGGELALQVSDATCGPVSSSYSLTFRDPGTITVTLDPKTSASCQRIGTNVNVIATITNALPPYTLTWSDGTVQTLPISASPVVTRTIVLPVSGLTASVVSGHDSVCTLKVAGGVLVNAIPDVGFAYSGRICPSQTGTATLVSTPPAGSSIGWGLSNGTIVSGQGTTSVQFISGASGVLTCSIVAPSGCNASSQASITVWGTPAAPQPVVTPSPTAPLGSLVKVAWTIDPNTASTTIGASTPAQPAAPQCSGSLCSSTYSAASAGSVTFTVHALGHCGEVVNGTATLTVQ